MSYALFGDGRRRRILYDNGLPFSDSIALNLDSLRDRVDIKKAALVIVDGGVGEGKSTLAVECLEYYQKAKIDEKHQYGMGGTDFQEKLQMCIDAKLPAVLYDEAGDFSRRGSLTAFNRMLNRVFETYRGYKIIVFLALPNFKVLDQDLFDNRIPRLLLNCHDRGQNYGSIRGYSLWRMFYLLKEMKRLTVPVEAYEKVEPNFRGHFLDLDPKTSARLEAVSLAGKREILSENILSNRGLVSVRDIMKRLGKSRPYVTEKIRKLSIKPEYVYKKMRYFSKSVFDEISEAKG